MRKLVLNLIVLLLLSNCSEDKSNTNEDDIPEMNGYDLVWNDEFDTTSLDTSKWEYQTGDGSAYGIPGWGNNELQFYTNASRNISIEDGILKIRALDESFGGKNYTSARIRTSGKVGANWKYGLFVARIKLPKGRGLWPAFWMLPENPSIGWPMSGEIDIMEMVAHETNIVHGTVHFGQPWPNNSSSGRAYQLEQGEFIDNFHEFMVIWEEDEISWYVDNFKYFQVTPPTLVPQAWPFNDNNFHLLLNMAVGGNWPGSPDANTVFPQVLEVDWVRVYKEE